MWSYNSQVQGMQLHPIIFELDLNYTQQFWERLLNYGQICKDLEDLHPSIFELDLNYTHQFWELSLNYKQSIIEITRFSSPELNL